MNITLSSKPVRVDNVRIRKQADGYALFDLKTTRFFMLNDIAYFIWNKIDGSVSVKEIAEQLFNECKNSPELQDIAADIIEIIQELNEKNLIVMKEKI